MPGVFLGACGRCLAVMQQEVQEALICARQARRQLAAQLQRAPTPMRPRAPQAVEYDVLYGAPYELYEC